MTALLCIGYGTVKMSGEEVVVDVDVDDDVEESRMMRFVHKK